MSLPFSCCLLGEGALLVRCAELLQIRGHRILALVTSSSAAADWAAGQGLRHTAEAEELIRIGETGFDYLFSVVNTRILGAEIIRAPRRCAINFHDGPLPRYRGLHTPVWALLNGEKRHGVTWHVMTDRVDAGDILAEEPVEMSDRDSSFTLNAKCLEAGLTSFTRLVDALGRGDLHPVPQPPGGRLYLGHARPTDACVLSFEKPARELERIVRASDWGPYPNPFASARLCTSGDALIVTSARALDDDSRGRERGAVLDVSAAGITLATADAAVRLESFALPTGEGIGALDAAKRLGLEVGTTISEPDEAGRGGLVHALQRTARDEPFWVERLVSLRPLELPAAARPGPETIQRLAPDIPSDLPQSGGADAESRGRSILVAALAYFARLGTTAAFDVGFISSPLRSLADLPPVLASTVPCRVVVDSDRAYRTIARQIGAELEQVSDRFTFALDVLLRYPALKNLRGRYNLPVVVQEVDQLQQAGHAPGAVLTVSVDRAGSGCIWSFRENALDAASASGLARQFTEFCAAAAARPDARLRDIPLLGCAERHRIVNSWNPATLPELDAEGVHQLIERQAATRPASRAVVADDREMTFGELDAYASDLASTLRAGGVGPGSRVGVLLPRRSSLIVALLAVWKAGGTYVPLDPLHPPDRLAFMLEDSDAALLITERAMAGRVPAFAGPTLFVDGPSSQAAASKNGGVAEPSGGGLAYIIYTSGSTGRPKGVMVTHDNVLSFFAGMDRHLEEDDGGTWLAVTSVSFDISVLELWWTLARGYTVVLHGEDRPVTLSPAGGAKSLGFSLAYFSSDSERSERNRYRLLLDGARFADQHGFTAVWTPERHFHAFGGLYPNPAVTSAAVAAVTERIHIRAGSVVLPLHDPVRVAEEWAVVDNLSNGRVGVSFASGWQPNDFVLAPDRYTERKEILVRDLGVVKRLWQGGVVERQGPGGQPVDVKTLPRPVQSELPVWLTAAGNPETFRLAGELGASVLTHLLGQDLDDLSSKLALYRSAWRDAGHEGDGHVTLMLHTFIGADAEEVKAQVRGPLCDYLRSSVDLLKPAPSSFPAWSSSGAGSVSFERLQAPDVDALLDHAFDRYYETSGLLGTPRTALAMIERLRDRGIDEIACLIDFGLSDEAVLAGLEHLVELKRLADASAQQRSIVEDIREHGVSHLQCTPSLAAALVNDSGARPALGQLRTLLVGGEPLNPDLAQQLRAVVRGRVLNMYGPTETTVWSTADEVNDAVVTLGRPLANTRVYVLNDRLEVVGAGVPGEIVIGGQGVTRGYWNRPDLTADRFLPDPFHPNNGLVYRTGDVGRYLEDGRIEFLGRADRQVKVRGHRVEPEEIERTLASHRDVREAAVIADGEAGRHDVRLRAYLASDRDLDLSQLRAFVESRLPDYMVPVSFTVLEALPKTAGGKIDRRALPLPGDEPAHALAAPDGPVQEALHAMWLDLLQAAAIGVDDDFFDLGGHSLLAIQLVSRIQDVFKIDLPLRTLFEERSIRNLARALQAIESAPGLTEKIARLFVTVSRLSDDEVLIALQKGTGGVVSIAGEPDAAAAGLSA